MVNDDELGTVVEQLELGPEDVDSALGRAIEKTANNLTNAEIPTLPKQEPYNLSELLDGVERVSPELRQELIKALLAKHYGTKDQKSSVSLVNYSSIADHVSLVKLAVDRLPDLVREYSDVKPFETKHQRNLRMLDDMGLIDGSETYLAAFKDIDKLYKEFKFNKKKDFLYRNHLNAGLFVTSIATASTLVYDLLWSAPGFASPLVASVGIFFSALVASIGKEGYKDDLYISKMTEHVGKNVDAVAIGVPVALNLAKEMQKQLENPTTYNENYSKPQIAVQRELGLQYFARTIPLLEGFNGSN